MQASQIPTKVPLPFANSGTKNAIPTASQIGITAGAASLTDGFPPLTMTPLASGGVPPAGADFNGILNLITAVQQWQSAGGIFKYDAAFATSIGGYPKGAILMSTTNASTWLNMVDNNTADPDAGGANWVSMSAGRLLNVRVFGPGTYTYTPTPGTTSVIVEVQAGGGAGGGCAGTGAGQVAAAGGGGGGGFARSRLTSAFSGVTITVGAGVAGVLGAAGSNGNSSSFGALLSATGGGGGTAGAAIATPAGTQLGGGSVGGVGAGGNISNGMGGLGRYGVLAAQPISGEGGGSMYGAGAYYVSSTANGLAGTSYGAGGSGGSLLPSVGGGAVGGAGAAGVVVIYEYA